MSYSSYNGQEIIEQYAADLHTWEQQLQSLEEEAKALSLDNRADRHALNELSDTYRSAIREAYNDVEYSRRQARQLEQNIERVEDGSKFTYRTVPNTRSRRKIMKNKINDLDAFYHFTDERQDYLSHVLDEEFGIPLKESDEPDSILGRINMAANKQTAGTIQQLQRRISENPNHVYIAGLAGISASILTYDWIRKKLGR